ncbi:tachykinins-like isoform X3 [Odontomachus brunneus]|uniref:tachykinins-like isoform X3 n=1 Tax=Odontomachus brunneus TaxID=486640 RepID=UPI0013F2A6AE|nr:tachykinins-like isoform X3 [Odontomachus brunneus]
MGHTSFFTPRMHINSIFFLAIWMTSVAEELPVNNVQPTKQTSLRFPEIREKKYPISLEYGDFSKRAQIGFQNMRGNKYFITPNVDEDFSHDEFEKRASMGFQGMRGKKDYLTSDFKDFYLHNDYKKKALMGFQGMRGKKVVSEDGYYKRAPMGFQGMRGKKSMEENTGGKKSYVFENPQEHEKRFLGMGFQGMRGKKENFPVEWEKRIPIGFQGIRDKETLLDEIEDFEKRVTSFQDTRGKKDTFQNYVDYYIDTMDFDKRALMGFQGMRGKKDSDKRTSMGFQGMRGKRNMGRRFGIGTVFKIRSSSDNQGKDDRRNSLVLCQVEKRMPFRYFEIRGKKNPQWGSRGKFVGVRGKKWATTPYEDGNLFVSIFDNIERIDIDGDSSAILDLQ